MKPNPYLIDDDSPEWTDEDFKTAKRGYDFFTPEQLLAIEEAQRRMKEQRLQKERKPSKPALIKEIAL
jgi:hypothetical protein